MSGRSAGLPAATGQHFLRPRYAAELVRLARPDPRDLVFDLGAGTGAITALLAATGARVIAVERDPQMIRRLHRRFAEQPGVTVVAADLRRLYWPRRPFRIVANPPFGCTTALLSRLLDSGNRGLVDAHLVLQRGAAVGLVHPHRAVTRRWAAAWQVDILRRLPASCFVPPPPVDAAVVVIRRRP